MSTLSLHSCSVSYDAEIHVKQGHSGGSEHMVAKFEDGSTAMAKRITLNSFYKWMRERHRIYQKRLQDPHNPPWTTDHIMRSYRFCNVFRVLDRVTQFLIINVIETGDQSPIECIFRILVFRFFNRISTWELLSSQVGPITMAHFDCRRYSKALADAYNSGVKLYTGAYIIPSPGIMDGPAFENHILLLGQLLHFEVPRQIVLCKTMKEAWSILKQYNGLGKFLSYQCVTLCCRRFGNQDLREFYV
jgi:hypothetical protein